MKLVATLALLPALAFADGKRPPGEKAYFDALLQKGLIEKGAGTAAELYTSVRDADELLVAGDTSRAATRLYAIVEGARYSEFSETDDFQNAEYLLGVALAKGGAVLSARRYLERVAARKTGPYVEPSLKRLVDLALDARDARGGIARIDQAGIDPAKESPLRQEIDYLRGRAAYEGRQYDVADDEFSRIGPSCRFYSSAIYLRGVIAAKKGDLNRAQDAFCVIADVKTDDPLRFVVDGRYFTIRDLARLGLARVAHEQSRYDDAFYHYFSIPADSDELPHALYESAWSMLQNKKWDLAKRLADELLKQFPSSPLTAEGELLRATLAVKTCHFGQASKGFEDFLTAYEPVEIAVGEAEKDSAARRALAKRLLEAKDGDLSTVEGRLVKLLSVDPSFFRLRDFARGLRSEADDAAGVAAGWTALQGKLGGADAQPVAAARAQDDAAALLERTATLGSALASAADQGMIVRDSKDPRPAIHKHAREELATLATLETRRAKLASQLRKLAAETAPAPASSGDAQSLSQMAARDRAQAASLRVRAAALADKLDDKQGELLGAALTDLKVRLATMLRHARLGKIDSLIGQKKRLEKEIEDLASGKFPASMQSRLHIEGLIGDDEEYWPFEGEYWADEYENFK